MNKSKNFTSDCSIQMPPTVPINHELPRPKPKKERGSHCVIPRYTISAMARLKHSNFLKVTESSKRGPRRRRALKETAKPTYRFNYELFNCNNFNIRYWSWNYRGCWHQTCPPIASRNELWPNPIAISKANALSCYFLSLPPCVRIG